MFVCLNVFMYSMFMGIHICVCARVCRCVCVIMRVCVPGEDEAVQVDPLALGDPGGPVQPLGRLQHVPVQLLDELLLRGHVQPLLLQVVSQGVDVWLDHLYHSKGHSDYGLEEGHTAHSSTMSIHTMLLRMFTVRPHL